MQEKRTSLTQTVSKYLQQRTETLPVVQDVDQEATHLSQSPKSDAEKRLDRYIALSVGSIGVSAVSYLAFPPLILTTLPVLFYISVPLYEDAYEALAKDKQVRVAVVDAALITVALATGQWTAVAFATATVMASNKLLLKTEDQSQQVITDLFRIQQDTVFLVVDGNEIETPFAVLQKGDVIVVNAGEAIPVDGKIVEGVASVDQQILTGEAQLVEKSAGESVFASTLVLTGRIKIEVETTGGETTVAQIGRVLAETTDYKTTIQARGNAAMDRASLPILGVGAAATALAGPIGGVAAMTSCLASDVRLVAPLVMLTYLRLMTREGILVKDGRVLDLLNEVDTLVFDKTGTLTVSVPHVAGVHCFGEISAETILTYAAAAEYKQTHPIAQAILNEADQLGLTLPPIDEAEVKVGYGLAVMIEKQSVRVGSLRFMRMEEIAIPSQAETLQTHCHTEGASLVMIAIDGRLVGAIELHTTIRPEAPDVIEQLRSRFPSMIIISGDHERPTAHLAQQLGIDTYHAETLPEQKASFIAGLQAAGKSVCYVGDGINDSIALKQANVSVSLRGASKIATDTAQIVLMNENLHQLETLFALGERYNTDMTKTMWAKSSPALIGVPGAFFLHFNLVTAVALSSVGLAASVWTALKPLADGSENTKET
ncbi:MAG: heavy metal translocating P-type ATPase [Candidatus Promineifilaceae bacterium]